MIGEHRQSYHLRHDELGPCGCFPPSILTGVLQEAAIDGSAARGFPLAYYRRARAFWVLRRITFRHERPLRYGDSLEVTTWVSRVGRTSPTREYRLESASRGETIARVRTHWVYIDALTGQPKVIPDELREGFAPTGEVQEVLAEVPGGPLDPSRHLWSEQRTAESGDVDLAGHVKCCRYVSWLEDLLGRAFASAGAELGTVALASFDLQLLSSARALDRVQLVAQADPVWKVEVSAQGGQVLALASLWPRRPDAARRAFDDLDVHFADRLRAGPQPS